MDLAKKKGGRVVATSGGDGQEIDDKRVIPVNEVPGEDPDLTLVRVRLHPVFHASTTMVNFDQSLNNHSLKSIAKELGQHEKNVKAGDMGRAESLLINQANTLDVIFNALAQRAGANVGKHQDTAERYLRMALKAQSQCRTSLETLAEIKAPRSATFIKQANIGQQQQINNGPTVNGASQSRAHETKSDDATKELISLEDKNATLDTRGTGAAGGTNSQLETVGAVKRAEKRGRKNAQ
jgi:hypothetical protein